MNKLSSFVFLNKKGVSPLIATVLLIGFTVALAAVVITWGGRFVQQNIEDVDRQGSASVITGAVGVDLQSASIDKKQITVENKGTAPLTKLIVRGNGETEEIILPSSLNQFEIRSFSVSNGNIFSEGTVEVIPGADPDNDGQADYFSASKADVPVTRTAFRVFATSVNTYNGDLDIDNDGDGIEEGDANCQILADTIRLGGKWKAWLSNAITSPLSSFFKPTLPYTLINGAVVANDWVDLHTQKPDTTYLTNAINVDETGTAIGAGSQEVLTGTNVSGGATSNHCNSWTDSTTIPQYDYGAVGNRRAQWTLQVITLSCDQGNRLYCFEQPLPFE